jgi:cobalt-zinc-cadmium efflux system membrane fusion protein
MKRLLLPFLFLLCAPALAAAGGTVPRLEASSELFELVARLHEDELSILVDRYESNEPVLGAKVEVRLGELKALAKFHADHGDYAVDDPALLKALAAPGEHALIFMIVSGEDSDLLDATLVVADDAAHDDAHIHWLEWILVAGGALVVLGIILLVLRRRRLRHGHAAAIVLAVSLLGANVSDAAPGAHGPGGEHLDQPAAGTSASGLARLPDGSVSMPKSAQRRLEIRTVLAPQTEAAVTVELPGRVVMDPNAGGRVQPVHGGRVEPAGNGLPVAGQKVAKGQVLAWVRHHAEPFAEANQQAQLAELRAARSLAEQKLARLEGLEGTVPRKEIDAARIEARSLAERERRVSASIASREALVAPIAGVIAVASAVAGQVVEARDVLFEVVDPARLLVEAVVADVALAERIAGAHLAGNPDAKLRVAGIGRSLRDGVLPVTFRVEAGKEGQPHALAIGQPVTVLAALRERVKGIVLPAQAVVRDGANQPVVWIKSGAERFLPQAVQVRPLDAGRVVVTGGLGADNRVVVQGADLIAQIR